LEDKKAFEKWIQRQIRKKMRYRMTVHKMDISPLSAPAQWKSWRVWNMKKQAILSVNDTRVHDLSKRKNICMLGTMFNDVCKSWEKSDTDIPLHEQIFVNSINKNTLNNKFKLFLDEAFL
jgi:hypothetical protein